MRGFSAKIMSTPPATANSEKARRRIRRARYGGSGIEELLPISAVVRPRARAMLCSAPSGSRIPLATPSPRRLRMPRYEFFCRTCKKLFSTVLSLVDYEEGEVLCPHCGSKNIEQCWSAFSAITSKKSA